MKTPYQDWKKKSQKRWDEFIDKNCFFAYNDKQFEEGLEKLHTTENGIVRTYTGMFVLKNKTDELHQLMEKTDQKETEMMKDPDFVYDMFRTELADHEYCVTFSYEETFDACGVTAEQVNNNPMWLEQLNKARKDYIKDMIAWEEREEREEEE